MTNDRISVTIKTRDEDLRLRALELAVFSTNREQGWPDVSFIRRAKVFEAYVQGPADSSTPGGDE